MSQSKGWSCYLIQCADGSYYVGVATDVRERVEEHNSGTGGQYIQGWGDPAKQYLVRVFVDVDREPAEVITVYRTSKIDKHWRAES
jgi:predicted GIY-YIG superfamily endonuclease